MSVEKVALITAGGSGMGADAARKLAADGFRVGILSSSGKGEALGKELGGFGDTGSNRSNDDIAALVEGATDRWGRVDVLVNSAGHGPKGPVLDISDDDWHLGMEVYLLNVVRPVRLVTPVMQAQGGGAIRANNVLPGFIDSLPETEDRRARIPMGRYGKADEVSSLISWLASEQGAYMTGQNLRIDGGLTRAV